MTPPRTEYEKHDTIKISPTKTQNENDSSREGEDFRMNALRMCVSFGYHLCICTILWGGRAPHKAKVYSVIMVREHYLCMCTTNFVLVVCVVLLGVPFCAVEQTSFYWESFF